MKDFHVDGLKITALTDRAKERISYHIFASNQSLAASYGFSYETNALNIPLITKGMEFEWVNQPSPEVKKKPVDKRPFWVRKMVKDFTPWEKFNWYFNPWMNMTKPYTVSKVLVRLHNHIRFYVQHYINKWPPL